MRPTLSGLVILALGWTAAVAPAAEDEAAQADGARIETLVRQLGDNEYSNREAASDALTAIGRPALGALEAAARHPDREIRYRSQRIFGEIMRFDQERRLEAFLSGDDEEHDYDLPAWTRFRKGYGDSAASRRLFVEMQRADADLLKALEHSASAAADMLTLRLSQAQQTLQNGGQTVSTGQAAATLFVAAEEDVTLSAQARSLVLNQCTQQPYRDLLTSSSRKGMTRKMLAATITRSEDWASYMAMQIAMQYGMKEGLVPAVRMLDNPGNRTMIQYALATIAKLGNESHLPAVEKLLDDQTVVNKIQHTETKDGKLVRIDYEMQIRDAALATAILLSGQKLTDFFDVPDDQRQLLGDTQVIYYNPRMIGFTSNDERAKVFDKWARSKPEKKRDPSGGAQE
jgi:hypothetical protein